MHKAEASSKIDARPVTAPDPEGTPVAARIGVPTGCPKLWYQVLICDLPLNDTHCCIPPQVHFSYPAPYRQDPSAQSTPGVSSSTRIKLLAARTPAPPPPRAAFRQAWMPIT